MFKRLALLTIPVAAAAALVQGLVLLAQAGTPPGTYIPASQWQKELASSRSALGIVAGQTATIVPNVIIRRRLEGPNNASVHTAEGDGQDVTEIYQILDGSGTSVTGGSLPDPRNRSAGITGGEAHEVKAGDFVVIPPGTAHWFSKINDHITYLEVRLPGRVAPKK